jgi:23S rRNA (adenine2503-C2)-methyltransferase
VQAILGLELTEIRELLGDSQPSFRARQIYEAIYSRRAADFSSISVLPAALRDELSRRYAVGLPQIGQRYDSVDGTRRYLLSLEDGRSVETVLMPEEGRDTLCISTQVGCPVNCHFCLTALMGLERNLTAGEIVGQVIAVARDSRLPAAVGRVPDPPTGKGPGRSETCPTSRGRLNIVMMGMGEPLLNLESVLKATRLLTDPAGLGLSPRRITLSTSGIVPKIAEMGRAEVRPKLAVSLNASTEEMRQQLMPITRKYHLKDLLEACRAYPLRPWEKLTFEYVLLGGVNDTEADARRVVKLLANLNTKVNLIALNPGPGIPYETPAPDRVLAFQAIIRRSLPCFIRKPRGRDIFAACGQLKRMEAEAI